MLLPCIDIHDQHQISSILVFTYNVHKVMANRLARDLYDRRQSCIADGRAAYPYISYLLITTFRTFADELFGHRMVVQLVSQ